MQLPSTTHTDRPLNLIALCALVMSGFATCSIHAQQPASALPATSPTNPLLTSQLQAPSPPASSVTYGIPVTHPATVTYTAGRLTVVADDSSLNQVLHSISASTGMKVTGGVADERVFGTYGPDTPARVLSALLDGTGSNILIVQNNDRQTANTLPGFVPPFELVLTPRNGGPTPPSPNPQPFDNTPRSSSQPIAPVRPSYPIAQPTPPPPNPGVANPGAAIGGAAPSTDSSTDQQSPNGVRTPQQIYEQLQQIRQLQQQQQQTQQQQQQQQQQTKP